jgi:hypothetical protein
MYISRGERGAYKAHPLSRPLVAADRLKFLLPVSPEKGRRGSHPARERKGVIFSSVSVKRDGTAHCITPS